MIDWVGAGDVDGVTEFETARPHPFLIARLRCNINERGPT
jgi:hypothetical protein